MSVRLSADEAWEYVERCATGILTTLRRDGFPVTLPVWFVALDRALYVRTPARSKKVLRMRADPRVAFLVESGDRWAELKAVSMTGTASLVEDEELRSQVLSLLSEKYRGRRTTRAVMPTATVKHYATPEAIIRITPDERLLTWDNSRIRLSE